MITVQVIGNLMRTAADEVEISMIRTAHSPLIKESFDCSAAILSPDGEFWALADAIPAQLGVLSTVQRSVYERQRNAELFPGDILFTNDPDVGVPHLNDFVSLAPVFVGSHVISVVATLMHHADIGGKTPGSMPADATELYQEGLRLPVQKLVARDELVKPVLEILLANSRTPGYMIGDLRAQVAASRLGARRVQEAVSRFGEEVLRESITSYLDYSERLARSGIGALEPGGYSATRRIDNASPSDLSNPLVVVADVRITEQSVSVDFSRSSDQVRRPLNAVLSNGLAASLVALRCVLGGEVPMNGGLQRVISVSSRVGSIMNPVMPAPLGARALATTLAYDCVLECLGHAAPTKAVGNSSGGTTMPYVWMPADAPGAPLRIMIDNSLTGGTGGGAWADGLNAIDNSLTNAMNYPAEAMERDFPVIVESNELRIGSGGRGRRRGGLGLRRAVRFLAPGSLALRGHRYQFPPQGIFGGEPGLGSSFWLIRDGARIELSPQASGIATEPGDVLVAETPGGGGYGDPRERDATDASNDIRHGYVIDDRS